jgi:hypothetical protein
MKARSFLFAVVFAFSAVAVAGQKCPTIKVSGPALDPFEGTSITFSADVRGLANGFTPTFNWTLSAGIITSGQGTSAVLVDTTGILSQGGSITATVAVGGLDRRCVNNASTTAYVRIQPKARLMDQYGTLRTLDEQSRLDNFAIELQNDPTAKGYVLTYRGKTTAAVSARAAGERAKNYLVNTRGIDSARIELVYAGNWPTPMTQLWIVPDGAKPPTALPEPPKVLPPAKPPGSKTRRS